MTTRWVSPNDIQNAARDMMLDGREPITEEEWCLCVNFWASNVTDAHVQVCNLLAKIFDCPLSEDYVTRIAEYQKERSSE